MRQIFFIMMIIFICSGIATSDIINIYIKGVDDGRRTSRQQDYKEALLFAKREAIERAGVQIKSLTTVQDMVANFDYIESKAEAVLLPGYHVMDIGYQIDGTYLIILIGQVQSIEDTPNSKELRYAKSLWDKGEAKKAQDIINKIINDNLDDSVLPEAMYYGILWNVLKGDPSAIYTKLKAYYPESNYVKKLSALLNKRERERVNNKNKYGVYGLISQQDGHFIIFDSKPNITIDTKKNLMWYRRDNGEYISWDEAKDYCKKFHGGGYKNWRLPTLEELKSLYDPTNKHNNHLKTTFIHTTQCMLWLSDVKGIGAGSFNACSGNYLWQTLKASPSCTVLPVRTLH